MATRWPQGIRRRKSPQREVLRAKLRDAAPGVAAAASVACPPFESRGLSPMGPMNGRWAFAQWAICQPLENLEAMHANRLC